MKFLHTADLHLGKIVSGVSMLAEQEYILTQITQIAEEEQVDALILAGDLYDRAVPPADAVKVLNDILVKWNVELGIPIFAISGIMTVLSGLLLEVSGMKVVSYI